MNLPTTLSGTSRAGTRRACIVGWRIALFLAVTLTARAGEETFYLGTFTHSPSDSQGIYVGTLDTETGKLGPLRLAAKAANPNFLALSPEHRFLFAALDAAVESFAVQPDGTLRAINQQPSGGGGACHVSIDGSGREIFVANYGTGSIAAFPVAADGTIGSRTALELFTGSGPNKGRQASPHAHAIYADPQGRFAYACDLGTDNIWIYHLDAKGGLTPADPPFAKVPPGSGPRHLVIDGDFVYVVNEMGASVSVFQRDVTTGALQLVQTVDNIQGSVKPGSTAAEIALSHGCVYVSTRGQEVISVFLIDQNGIKRTPAFAPRQILTLLQNIPSPVKFPRSFGLDPSGRWMIVAGQNDNRIAVMKIDAPEGRLAPTDQAASVGSPVCVLFVPSAQP